MTSCSGSKPSFYCAFGAIVGTSYKAHSGIPDSLKFLDKATLVSVPYCSNVIQMMADNAGASCTSEHWDKFCIVIPNTRQAIDVTQPTQILNTIFLRRTHIYG